MIKSIASFNGTNLLFLTAFASPAGNIVFVPSSKKAQNSPGLINSIGFSGFV